MSTQAEVEVSYDVSNEFFQLWLDRRMNYTCALWEGTTSLEYAQDQKLEWLSRAARVSPGSRVLDIGCGWGSCLEFMTENKGAQNCVGITLSSAQHQWAQDRQLTEAEFKLCDYRQFEPQEPFDAVISICMMEHISTPEEVREGLHIKAYRDYFRRAHEWTRPGAWFGLQTILRDRVPRDRQDLKDIGWITQSIFPGGLSLRLEDIVKAVNPYWEIMEVRTRRGDYEKTCAEWLRRLRVHEAKIRDQWGDRVFEDYDRYLRTCVKGFQMRYQSLAQYALRRID